VCACTCEFVYVKGMYVKGMYGVTSCLPLKDLCCDSVTLLVSAVADTAAHMHYHVK